MKLGFVIMFYTIKGLKENFPFLPHSQQQQPNPFLKWVWASCNDQLMQLALAAGGR